MAIEWDLGLATGIPGIDEQHREVFRRLDALFQAIRGGFSRDEVARTIDFLGAHVVDHFAAEESLMEARGYPGLEAHRSEHRAFAAEFRNFREDIERGGPSPGLVMRVNTQLTGWLRNHILKTDRALAAWLAGR